VLSTNNRGEKLSAVAFLFSIEKPNRKPRFFVATIILLKASIMMTNGKGDKGSPYFRPRKLLKNLVRVPFTKTEKCTEEIQCDLITPFLPKSAP
jgi:hypothetical protein